ncbi:MAG: HEAT repeat domain-containing protein [Chloroflexi bacterium]|nr:MAG: HEAT repeat domain-containing protein [Chloroflexota bacterium]
MSEHAYHHIETLLASTRPEEIHQGLELVRKEIARVGSKEARPLFEMVSALFYFDPLDRPDLVPILDEAVSLVVGFGEWIIPELLNELDAGDFKAQLAIGHALGRLGADAIQPLISEYKSSSDGARHTFILFALGKIKSPRIVEALPLALEAAGSPELEFRDTATRALGKFAESMLPGQVPEELRRELVERLHRNLADTSPGIRAKAVRSLGKMAKFGHLADAERLKLKDICQHLAGTDERYEWDHAYIVRREAEESLKYV